MHRPSTCRRWSNGHRSPLSTDDCRCSPLILKSSYRLHCMPSHLIVSSPARCRVVRPPAGNLDRGQSFTIWLIVCFAALQLQDGSGILRQDLQHIVSDRFSKMMSG